MSLRFLPEAEEELEHAARWYEARGDGLGARLLQAVAGALTRVVANPRGFPRWREDRPHHKCIVDRFPYAIMFRVERDEIVVVAIAHAKRRPGYWSRR